MPSVVGGQLAALEDAVELSNPIPAVLESEEDFADFANATFVMAAEGIVSLLDKATRGNHGAGVRSKQLVEKTHAQRYTRTCDAGSGPCGLTERSSGVSRSSLTRTCGRSS